MNTFRRGLFALWCWAILGTINMGLGATEFGARPNVVLILMDDLGWADLGCYGNTYHQSPHIDRLATSGMRFTQAYAAAPVCSPSRACLLTGKSPARLHLTDWLPGSYPLPSQRLAVPYCRQELPLSEVTLAERLQSAGYATAHIGKWHLGARGYGPCEQGFDLNVGGDDWGFPPSYFGPFDDKKHRLMPGLNKCADGAYLTDLCAEAAVKFIRDHSEEPFFLYLPHFAVHTPLQAKRELIARFERCSKTPGQPCNPAYAAMLASADESVGKIMKELRTQKLSERTIVIFTSDNGGLATSEWPYAPPTCNAPLRNGKGHLYEGGIRVPLIVSWPWQVIGGSTCDTPVCSADFVPTILELCGVDCHKDSGKFDGVSLAPLLKSTGDIHRDALYWHYPHYSPQFGKPSGAVRAGDYKLIEFYEDRRRELFNLKDDSAERTNLADQEPANVQELSEKLSRWRRSMGAQMMVPNPFYRPNLQAMDGDVVIHARSAQIHGPMLRFDPLPHQDSLTCWERQEDWVSFEFELDRPAKFDVELLYRCAKGSGGSEVEVAVGGEKLSMLVQETGDFEKFVIGTVEIQGTGRYSLTVKPQKKPGLTVMDLRRIRLLPLN